MEVVFFTQFFSLRHFDTGERRCTFQARVKKNPEPFHCVQVDNKRSSCSRNHRIHNSPTFCATQTLQRAVESNAQ